MDYQGATMASKVQMWSVHAKCELNKFAAPLEVTKNDQVMKIDVKNSSIWPCFFQNIFHRSSPVDHADEWNTLSCGHPSPVFFELKTTVKSGHRQSANLQLPGAQKGHPIAADAEENKWRRQSSRVENMNSSLGK